MVPTPYLAITAAVFAASSIVSPPQNWSNSVWRISPFTGRFHDMAILVSAMPIFVIAGEPMDEKRNLALFNSLSLRYSNAMCVLSNSGSIDVKWRKGNSWHSIPEQFLEMLSSVRLAFLRRYICQLL